MTETKSLTVGNFALDFYSSDLSRTSIESVGNEVEDIVQLTNFNGRVKVSEIRKLRRGHNRRGSVKRRGQRTIIAKSAAPPSEIKPMTTLLHRACERQSPRMHDIEKIYNSNHNYVFIPDLDGRLPIHHITCNGNLNNIKGKNMMEPFVKRLIQDYPESIIVKDKLGRAPFVDAITRWINEEYNRKDNDVIIANQLIPGLHEFNTTFPTSLELHPIVDLAFSILSHELDHSDEHIRMDIVTNISSVPFFVKSVLLIEDKDVRHRIMSSSLFKRIILEPKVVGLWMIPMIRTRKTFATRCIDYFQSVNDSEISDFIGRHKKVNPSDIKKFQAHRKLVSKEIGKNPYLLPSLPLLAIDEKARVSKLEIIQDIVNEVSYSCRFVYCFIINDIFMLISLILLFRSVTFSNGILSSLPKILEQQEEYFPDTKYELYAIVAICLYFFIRICSQSISILAVSLRVFITAFLVNSIVMVTTIVMTLTVCGMLFANDYFLESHYYLLSITIGLMWISLILYARNLSKTLAIFLSCIKYMMCKLLWFFMLLLSLIFMFGDVMHVYTTNNGEDCNVNTSRFNTSLSIKSPSDYMDEQPYCSTSLLRSYAAVYGILESQYDESTYQNDSYMVFVFMLASISLSLVLITVFIVIVMGAYEQVKTKAEDDFGIRSLSFAAQQVIFKHSILQTRYSELHTLGQKINFFYQWFVFASLFFTTIMMLVIKSFIFKTDEIDLGLSTEGIYYRIWIHYYLDLIIQSTLVVTQTVICEYVISYYVEDGNYFWDMRKSLFKHFRKATELTERFVPDMETNEWSSRLTTFEDATSEIVNESEQRICHLIEETEERMLCREDEMEKYLEDLILEGLPKKEKESGKGYGSSGDDSSDSDYEFTRSRILR